MAPRWGQALARATTWPLLPRNRHRSWPSILRNTGLFAWTSRSRIAGYQYSRSPSFGIRPRMSTERSVETASADGLGSVATIATLRWAPLLDVMPRHFFDSHVDKRSEAAALRGMAVRRPPPPAAPSPARGATAA